MNETAASHERRLYVLLPSPTAAYACLAVATGWERPDEYLHDLMQEPQTQGPAGVLLDLMLANGTRTRRFFHVHREPWQVQRAQPEVAVERACNAYLREHASQLDLSLLSPAMRYAVREGLLSVPMEA